MVPARPFFIGSDGWVRSRAWIWLFSSTHSTTALSGGFRYSPTTSVSFSRNRLSLETLKVRTRWGWSPAASQIRPTVAGLTPATFAMERVDQWVSPFGFVLVVRRMTYATFCAGMEGLRPRPPSILVRAVGPSSENATARAGCHTATPYRPTLPLSSYL